MSSVKQRVECLQCNKTYASRDSLQKHNRFGRCKATDSASDNEVESNAENPSLTCVSEDHRTENVSVVPLVPPHWKIPSEFRENPDGIHLGLTDNFLDFLDEQCGPKHALTRLRDHALAKLFGDCRLIEKFYFPIGKRPAIMLANTKKTHWIYYDEDDRAQAG